MSNKQEEKQEQEGTKPVEREVQRFIDVAAAIVARVRQERAGRKDKAA